MAGRPEDLVELLPAAEPFLTGGDGGAGLVLVTTLAGEFDAAHSAALAGAHLLATLPNELVARFDADALVDYRDHRPRMTFTGDRYADFSAPEIRHMSVPERIALIVSETLARSSCMSRSCCREMTSSSRRPPTMITAVSMSSGRAVICGWARRPASTTSMSIAANRSSVAWPR